MKKNLLFGRILCLIMTMLIIGSSDLMGQKTLPYSYGFENNDLAGEGWTTNNLHGDSGITTDNPNTGTYSFMYRNGAAYNPQTIISPLLEGYKAISLVLSHRNASSGQSTQRFRVSYSTNTSALDDFTDNWTGYITSNSQTYSSETFNFSDESDIKYIAIQYDRNGNYSNMYIDDIELSECQVSCSVPVNLALSSSSSNSATFTWDAVDGEIDGYEVYVCEDSTTPTEETSGSFTTTNSYTKNSLEENTHYYAWVRTKCEEDSYSSWSSSVDFTTDCGIKNLTYTYGFEDASDFDCWTMNNCYSSTKITSGTTNTGSYKFTFNYSTSHDSQTIITPELNTTSNGVRVEFYIRNQYSSGTPKLKIAYSTSGYDLASFDWINCTEATANSYYYYNYQYFGFDFPYDGIKYIAIQYDRNGSTNNIFMDDIKFSNIPTIDLPYEYGFETDSELNSWIKRDCSSSTNIKNGGHSGSYSFGFARANTMETQYLISPKLNGTTYGALISFYYTANANCKFQIGYSTTNNFTSSFTFGDEITETTASYKYYEYYCPASTKYICIKYVATSSSNYYLNIDDIKIVTFDKVSNGVYWDNLSDWTPAGLPSASDDIYINNSITIEDDVIANAHNITLGPNGSLTIADGGQLICNNSVTATFKKEITAYTQAAGKDRYYLIANPTTGAINPATVEGMLANNFDLYYFDQAQEGAEWRNYKQEVFDLENGKGYLYANSSNRTLQFSGTVPTGTTANITLSKSGSGDYAGFNLVGNPLSNNITSMTIGGKGCNYYKLNSLTGVFAASEADIIVGEAFMVEAPSDEATLRLNPAAKDEAGFTNEVIRLEVSNSKFTDVAYVYFGYHLPLTKISHLNDEAPMLYIRNGNDDRAVEVYSNREEVNSINVCFEAKTMGQYTISANMVKGEIKYMHLIDRLTGEDIDMLVEDSYTFIGAPSDSNDRFMLRFTYDTAIEEVELNSVFVHQSGNEVIVEGEGQLQVFDMMGRIVMNQRVNGTETVNGLNNGVYVFRMNEKAQKVVIR